jgi:hypothetical protein
MLTVNARPFILFLVTLVTSLGSFAQSNGKHDVTINVSGPANVSDSDQVNIGTYTKRGNGTMTLRHVLDADLIDLQSGTLLLGSANRITDTSNMRLSGGTFATGGNNETLGTLTLAANSTIDLGNGASILRFANSAQEAWTSGTTLTIVNWNGDSDALYFDSAMTALTSGQVSQIRFLNPNGVTGVFGAILLPDGKCVPVPEPATIGFGALLIGAIGLRERDRLARVFGFLRRKLATA